MRYYIYISRTKVDQLVAQIPLKHRQNIAAKLDLDLDIEPRTGGAAEPSTDEALFTRLRIVEEFLEQIGEIGSVDQPRGYFRGPMALSWGPYGFEETPEFVYFGGRTDNSLVGLGGSRKHVIGMTGHAQPHSHSATPELIRALRRQIRDDLPSGPPKDEADPDISPLRCVELATCQMGGPWEPMHFVARRLMTGPPSGRVWWNDNGYQPIDVSQVVLGTPLFVALA